MACLVNDMQNLVMKDSCTKIRKVYTKGDLKMALSGYHQVLSDPGHSVVQKNISKESLLAISDYLTKPTIESFAIIPEFLPEIFVVTQSVKSPDSVLLKLANDWMLFSKDVDEHGKFHEFIPEFTELLFRGSHEEEAEQDILCEVCKGFLLLALSKLSNFESTIDIEYILQFILRCSSHTDSKIRIEALEFWLEMIEPCKDAQRLREPWMYFENNILPQLIPLLLEDMRYAQEDYQYLNNPISLTMPNRQQKKKQVCDDSDEEEVDDGGGGECWTVRKASASVLDLLSVSLPSGFLAILLPLLEQRFSSSDWVVQETAILAIGAVGPACIQELTPHLGALLDLILRKFLRTQTNPLLRGTSCWSSSRFGFCLNQMENGEMIFTLLLQGYLELTADQNAFVQKAACSALAVLIENSEKLSMVRYLDECIRAISTAFQIYDDESLIQINDLVGVIFDNLNGLEDKKLIVPLAELLLIRYRETNPEDTSLLSLSTHEAVLSLCTSFGTFLGPDNLRFIASRCIYVLNKEYHGGKVDSSCLELSLGILSGLLEGLGREESPLFLTMHDLNFNGLLCDLIALPSFRTAPEVTRQSYLALIGDCVRYCPNIIPHEKLSEVIPIIILQIGQGGGVGNNASWSLGLISLNIHVPILRPHVATIANSILGTSPELGHGSRYGNTMAITLCTLGIQYAPQLVQDNTLDHTLVRLALPPLTAKSIFGYMLSKCCGELIISEDDEKHSAFQGIVNCIRLTGIRDVSDVATLGSLLRTAASIDPGPSHQEWKAVLRELEADLPTELWERTLESLDISDRTELLEVYGPFSEQQ